MNGGPCRTSRLNNADKLLMPRRKHVLFLFKLWGLAGFDLRWPVFNLVCDHGSKCP